MTEEELAKLRMGLLINSGTRNGTSQFLYATLLDIAEDNPTCSPSIEDLISLTKRSRRTIQKHLRSLEDLGLVISTPRPNDTGHNETREYFLPRLQEALEAFAAATHRKR